MLIELDPRAIAWLEKLAHYRSVTTTDVVKHAIEEYARLVEFSSGGWKEDIWEMIRIYGSKIDGARPHIGGDML